jgi:hypothetical protein
LLLGAQRVATVLTEPGGARGRDEWLELVGQCQSLINTLTAVQDVAIAEAARRESAWCEDGTLGETVHGRGRGRVSLDAPDVVAPVIGASHAQAQRRVEQAVRLAVGREPLEADDRDVPGASGLGRLHEAMASGQLDGYRAGVIAFELEVAPADVADAVVAALSGHLGDDAPTLRRRTRVLLHRISPDLVLERARRARAATGLRRWVAEPGVDEWHGTFPSEDAAAAWAAIDRLAHDLVAAGACSAIEQARGKALTDLVTGNSTIDVQVVLTVPVGTGTPDDTLAASPSVPEQLSVTAAEGARTKGHDDDLMDVPARTKGHDDAPVDVPARTNPHDDDLVEVQGARPCEPLLVRRGWLRDRLSTTAPRSRRDATNSRPAFVPCDPLTGARLDPGDHLATNAYRPGDALTALVRARDGRCRFPGCTVAARFCDLDHVRPWPTGRTAARNLLTLCRRHHRVKQRPGWRVHLAPDGTTTWADPTGRLRTTAPLDALQSLVLRTDSVADGGHARTEPITRVPTTVVAESTGPDVPGPPPAWPVAGTPAWSALETHLGIRLEHRGHSAGSGAGHELWTHPNHRRCTCAADLRAGSACRRARDRAPDLPPF